MPTVLAEFTDLPGTQAAVGRSGGHVVVADRPEGAAGGAGLGFNGAQLLALALGACLCNDLRYLAQRRGVAIATLSVRVALQLDGDPVVATSAELTVDCRLADGSPGLALIDEARGSSMVALTLARGIPVTIMPQA